MALTGGRQQSLLVVVLAILCVVAIAAAALMLGGSRGKGPATAQTAPPPPMPSSSALSGPFSVSGNRILAADGEQFVPYGFVLYCLAIPSVDCSRRTSSNPNTDADKMRAAASFWHADVVRLQVAQERLFDGTADTTKRIDQAYLAQLDAEVALANRLRMVAIITLQEQRFHGPPFPTASSVSFWTEMAQHYKSNPMVIFDLFNEPMLKAQDFPPTLASRSRDFPSTSSFIQNAIWNIWKSGGATTVAQPADQQQTSYTFVGMQQLINDIRGTGAHNIIVAEGNHGDHDLSGVVGLVKASGGAVSYSLSGSNIAYGVEPDLNSKPLGPVPPTQTPAQWDRAYGDLSKSVPIMTEAFQDWSPNGFCYTKSPTVLPQLLNYLRARHLGLISWALDPGILIHGNNLEEPTTYEGVSRQPCGRQFDPGGAIGPGADILQFFRQASPQTG